MGKIQKPSPKDYTNEPKMGEVKKSQLDESGNFLIVNMEDTYRIALGEHWATKQVFKTPEEAQEYINNKPWELLMNMAAIMAKFVFNEINNQK